MTDLSIVIPCYNEAGNAPRVSADLKPVLEELVKERSVELVFVDDGSTDDTRRAFESVCRALQTENVEAKVVPHERNMGLGAALRTGLGAAKGSVIVTTDSDATYRFDEIPPLLSCLNDGSDIVTASPYHPRGAVAGVAGYRLVLSRGSSWIYRMIVTPRICTWTSLFRAYRRGVIEATPFYSSGFLAGTEILVNAVLRGYRVVEYPTTLHSRTVGISKAKIARTIRAHLRFQTKLLAARLHLIPGPWETDVQTRARLWGTAALGANGPRFAASLDGRSGA
jgi:dolichol-phosphate mannosyltransferase